ncbi:MAG: putative LPS assembly protein LptD [candidate division KSB1 bacterium]|nr:putative LPS assembly protein LptD [candidate division KSB1 bacterium]
MTRPSLRPLAFCLLLPFAAAQAQSTPPDTSRRTAELDTLLTYRAQFHRHLAEERVTVLEGKAEVHYRGMTLKAERITVNWDEHTLTAEGVPDTVWEKSEGDPADSVRVVRYRGEPVFVDGTEELRGHRMVYNFRTGKGLVVRGRTQVEGGRYEGGTIKQAGKSVIWVAGGSYTTCDRNDPHYHFASSQMKIVVDDKVIARPVVLYFGRIPLAFLPFAVFPHTRGRQSGILTPHYGESQLEGRYLRGLGYYWAPNDYFDAAGTVDFFERSGWMVHFRSNYAIRYLLRGSISGSVTRKNFVYGQDIRRWDLHVSHVQTLDPTSSLQVSGYFVSDRNFYRDLSADLDQRLRRQLQSNATFTKNWTGSKNSLTVNVSETRDLETGSSVRMLPQVSFYHSQRSLFGTPRRSRERRWYHAIYYAYNLRAYQRVSRTEGLVTSSSCRIEETAANHSLRLSMANPGKLFGWLQVSQGLNVSEDWFGQATDYTWREGLSAPVGRRVQGFFARHTFLYQATLSTKLYGLFPFPGAGVEAVRHILSPTIGLQYAPDFSDPRWGYYQTFRTPSGRELRYDRFVGTPRGGVSALRFSVTNLFQAKVATGEKERKLDLFSWDISTAYNFRAPGQKLSDLSSHLRTLFVPSLNLSLDATHSFYRKGPGQAATYLWENGGWKRGSFVRLTYLRLSADLRLSGKRRVSAGRAEEPEPEEEDPASTLPLPGDVPRYQPGQAFEDFTLTWRASVSFSFEIDRRWLAERRRSYARISGLEMQLTRNWRLAYGAQLDLREREIIYQRITLYRDLHCWEAEFDWVPTGRDKRYYLRINVKAPQLRELKLEKRGGRAGYLGYGSFY